MGACGASVIYLKEMLLFDWIIFHIRVMHWSMASESLFEDSQTWTCYQSVKLHYTATCQMLQHVVTFENVSDPELVS